MSLIPVLEVGGTHVTGALVDPVTWTTGSLVRQLLNATGTADDILAELAKCAKAIGAQPGSHWGIGLPGPFEHATGIARYATDKFTALNGVDLGAALRPRIEAAAITFSDDAEDFLIGESLAGAAAGHDRVAGITLGTGIGSAFLAGGRIVGAGAGVPPGGDVYRLEYAGQPIEETVSRRAIRRRYAAGARLSSTGLSSTGLSGTGLSSTGITVRPGAGPAELPDVHQIAERARSGTDPVAAQVFTDAFSTLGQLLAPWLSRFGASALVVGGSIARSWDLVHPPLQANLGAVEVVPAAAGEEAPILGAAWSVLNGGPPAP